VSVPVRLRLTLGFGLVISLSLGVVALLAYARLESGIRQDLDRELLQRTQDLDAVAQSSGRPLDRVRAHGYVERGESFAEVLDEDGRVLDATTTLARRPLLTPSQARQATRSAYSTTVPSAPGLDEPARLLATPIVVGGRPAAFVVGITEGNGIETLDRVRRQLWFGVPAVALLTTLAGYVLIGVALRPVERMRTRAASISALSPGARLPIPPGRDELARLGTTLNELLDRLESSSVRQQRFVADASHELRTPLALMALELELAVRHDREPDELRASIASAREEVQRLTTLAEDLLLLSTTGEETLATEPVEVAALVERVAVRFTEAAKASGRTVQVDAGDGAPVVSGDATRLERAIGNLLGNAVQHGRGDIAVTVLTGDHDVTVQVHDSSGRLDPGVDGRAFDRFTRGGATGRSGLGLPIVGTVAQAHGGSAGIGADARGGVTAWIRLPCASSPHRTEPATPLG
jgi:signal transduction histidine kinase